MKIPTEKLVSELHKTQPYTLLVVLALIGFAVWSYMAHADTKEKAQNVDTRLAAVESQVNNNGQAINNVLALSIAAEIRTQHELFCQAKQASARRAIQRTIDSLQNDYSAIKGRYLPIIPCNGT